MKSSLIYFYNNNNNLVNLLENKKQYEKHKTELENIKNSQNNGISQGVSPEKKFNDFHDTMRGVFAQSREFNSRQKIQNILQDNLKIINKLQDISKGEPDSIARMFIDQKPKLKKKKRTKSRMLREEIQTISQLLEQEEKSKDIFQYANTQGSQEPQNYQDIFYPQQDYTFSMTNSKKQNTSKMNPNASIFRKSLNSEFRKEEQRQIAQQNINLINKIVNAQGNINHKDFEKEFRQTQKYKKNVRKYSKSRAQFLNNYLDTKIIRSNSFGIESTKAKKKINLTNNLSFQQSPLTNQQTQSKDDTICPQFKNELIQIKFEKHDNNQQNDQYITSEFNISDSNSKLSHRTQKNILARTEPDEKDKFILQKDFKTQSIHNFSYQSKKRSHSLRIGAANSSNSSYIQSKTQQDDQMYKPISTKSNYQSNIKDQHKQIQIKFKEQTQKRGQNLFKIKPPRSVSVYSNYKENMHVQNQVSPISNFRNNRILSPQGYKFRSHNLHIKRPLSQLDNSTQQNINSSLTNNSFMIQKSLSLIESEYEDKLESYNEVEFGNLKKALEQKKNIEQKQLQILDQNFITKDNWKQQKTPLSQKSNNFDLNSKISNSSQKRSEVKKQKTQNLNIQNQQKNKENISEEEITLKTRETLEEPSQNPSIFQQTNFEQNQKNKATKENQQQNCKDFHLQLNDIALKSPNQISQEGDLEVQQNQDFQKISSLEEKEKYLLINTKQRFFKPTIQKTQPYQIDSTSLKALINFHTEPIPDILLQQCIDKNNHQSNNNKYLKVKKGISTTMYMNGNQNQLFKRDSSQQNRKYTSPAKKLF